MVSSDDEDNSTGIQSCPNEVLQLVFQNLDDVSLARSSAVCSHWRELIDPSDPSTPDYLWARQASSLRLKSPTPYTRFRGLYASLRDHLWLHGKMWMGNRSWTGYILLSTYNSRTGAIDLTTILATRSGGNNKENIVPWSRDESISVAIFDPQVSLWVVPLLSFDKDTVLDPSDNEMKPPTQVRHVYRSLFRASAVPPELQISSKRYWPPPHIPAVERAEDVLSCIKDSLENKPLPAEAIDSVFRIRKWVVFGGAPVPSVVMSRNGIDDEVETFAAIREEHYTPDEEHPYRGVWVGDYSIHGCEFILFHQETPTKLKAVKITGDILCACGEITFIVDDLRAVIRIADEREWPGAKVIAAKGQIASHQYQSSRMINAEMICVGPSEIALLWHFPQFTSYINRFRRVDIQSFIYGSKE
ncbi:hypothetical protein L873DRAFT_1691259 [Choiromyces venosus 120613-1]|uniref:F-box domain-containing protein n=1 Tax=Choiromyces venosus 120613-1 TaxID=1336337 RepID=A0A3N4JGL3_9PEZI|nr:hypothetical protein L873DRAFT_1691259 [Choiromyces venosus 120613-1]